MLCISQVKNLILIKSITSKSYLIYDKSFLFKINRLFETSGEQNKKKIKILLEDCESQLLSWSAKNAGAKILLTKLNELK